MLNLSAALTVVVLAASPMSGSLPRLMPDLSAAMLDQPLKLALLDAPAPKRVTRHSVGWTLAGVLGGALVGGVVANLIADWAESFGGLTPWAAYGALIGAAGGCAIGFFASEYTEPEAPEPPPIVPVERDGLTAGEKLVVAVLVVLGAMIALAPIAVAVVDPRGDLRTTTEPPNSAPAVMLGLPVVRF